jgi:pyruvate-ferredoxin/flavodoxin oxidoreductase
LANSLFEDNAEFGYGLRVALNYKLENHKNIIESNLNECEKELHEL